jgi:maleylpyruvate isomerase
VVSYSELMDSAQRELSDQIDQATQRLLDRARVITEPDLRAPSLLPGWTRARVLAHVASGADAMRHLLVGVRTGRDRSGHASTGAQEGGLKNGAGPRPEELMASLADSAMALRTVARQLPDDRWQVPVEVPGLAPFPAAELLVRRLVEVELHHCDLGAGYGPARWPAAFAAMELPEPMRSWRRDRLGYPDQSEPGLSPPRVPGPYRPGQRLPGSWLGTR